MSNIDTHMSNTVLMTDCRLLHVPMQYTYTSILSHQHHSSNSEKVNNFISTASMNPGKRTMMKNWNQSLFKKWRVQMIIPL